ncbi:hypothetical protein TNCV_3994091 [Trichonephila clavipes]|uniref:Uncharacterized protein n=1 Tax=Trichonephila clavipes TaxID=2585209 RepID=A0A8X6VT74_TRICX|nr:hypothetical protein TNCV_3994091 [Trichonephila clavipes]
MLAPPRVCAPQFEKRWTRQIFRPHSYRACLGRRGELNCNSQTRAENHPRPENRVVERVGLIAPGIQILLFQL